MSLLMEEEGVREIKQAVFWFVGLKFLLNLISLCIFLNYILKNSIISLRFVDFLGAVTVSVALHIWLTTPSLLTH